MASLVASRSHPPVTPVFDSRRNSVVSTAASFQTAPLASGSESANSSVETLPAQSKPLVIPNGVVSNEPEEMHGEETPDAGIETRARFDTLKRTKDYVATQQNVQLDAEQPPALPDPLPERTPSQPPSPKLVAARGPPTRRMTSNDAILTMPEAGTSQISAPPFTQRDELQTEPLSTSAPSKNGHLSYNEGANLLHPSSAVRPTRRNTTGSAAPLRSSKHPKPPSLVTQLPADDPELYSDIQKQAEQLRRERIQRAKDEAEATAAGISKKKGHSRTGSAGARSLDEWKPVVGNVVGEGHVNYILMYNMLTGIRVAVSRCQAKNKRPITDEDYTAAHKYNFDVIGNELTPSAKYDFKFKDYAPWVFRELRDENFNIDPADYLLSLTSKYILSELGSPGKSGSFFYYSRDYRFIIKTIHHTEHKFLRKVLKRYHQHIKDNPHTLISRFYGLHRVKLPRGRKIHFVIMNNLFPAHRDIHETYDLKGSTIGRLYPEDKAADNPGAVLKDVNWIDRGRQLELGPYKRALLVEQLRRDVELLKALNVMDYSLLVGIHNMKRGNKDNIRSTTLKVFKPDIKHTEASPGARKWIGIKHAMEVRRAMRQSAGAKSLESSNLPDEDPNPSDRSGFIFYSDSGGYRATDDSDHNMEVIYYLGIIDICTPYNLWKKGEHQLKGLQADRHKISPVPAGEYGDRFFAFLQAVMRGGEGGQRFKAD